MNVKWKILYTQDAIKDKRRAYEAGYKDKIIKLLQLIEGDPFASYPPFEKLIGDMNGAYSRRINHQHRLVYEVFKAEKIIKIISVWTHYE